jgi:RIO kinase 1
MSKPDRDGSEFAAKVSQEVKQKVQYDTMFDPESGNSLKLSTGQQSVVKETQRKGDQGAVRFKGKEDRATCEQVMDPRTRMILFKMINQEVLAEVNGCISTGKEANVYHATSKEGDLAIKIYKTSILVFKDRDRYVSGEHRFKNGYCKSNPRKMVKVWAEKEYRNLRRLNQAGIRSPVPTMLRLTLTLIGRRASAPPSPPCYAPMCSS